MKPKVYIHKYMYKVYKYKPPNLNKDFYKYAT